MHRKFTFQTDHRFVKLIANAFATCFGIGYIRTPRGTPFGGTVTTAVGAALIVLLANLTDFTTSSVWFFTTFAVISVIGVIAIHLGLHAGEHDPRRVVIDELAGVWLTFALLPVGGDWLVDILLGVAVFLTFRVLDVRKPLGIRKLERFHGSIGVMLDDIGAGLLGAIILNAAGYLITLLTSG